MGKLSGCGPALERSYTGTSYVRVLQHMATLAGTEARRKPPGASHKRRVPRACQLLHSGEEHPSKQDAQEFSNPAYRAMGPTRPRSVESVSLDAGIGPNDGTQAAAAAPAEATKPNPTVPAGYPPDLGPLLEAIL